MGILITTLCLIASDEIYTAYPAFGDKEPAFYQDNRVKAVADKGITRELIVQCRNGEGVMVHDVVNDIYVDSKNRDHNSLSAAIRGTCS